MYKSKTFTNVIALTLIIVAGSAHAQGSYFGGGVALLDYSETIIEDEASLQAVFARLGKNFSESISGEIRVGFGIGDDTVDVFGFNANVELDNMFGAYVRGGVQASEAFFPYAVLGYTRGEVTASIPGFGSASESESDTSFGIGADIRMGGGSALNIEYMSYFDKDGVEIEGFSVGFVSGF